MSEQEVKADPVTAVYKIERATERSEAAETSVVARLERWRETLGTPIGAGRANPDNDLIYLMMDAVEVINGLRRYARSLERAQATQEPVND